MAMYDQQGQRHHSASRARLADERQTLKSTAGKSNPTPTAGVGKPAQAKGTEQDLSHMEPKEVVAKHGPAHKVEVMHDHAKGEHHVVSHHRGAYHKSTHGSAKEAHDHAAMMAGHESEEPEETPDNAAEEAEEQEHEGSIPGMA